MNEQTQKIYEALKGEKKDTKTRNITYGIIILVSFIMSVVGATAGNEALMMMGMLVFSFSVVIFLIILGLDATSSNLLKKSMMTLENTGSIQFIDEILNKQYKSYGKTFFSQNMFYIPGKMVVAYRDIKEIFPTGKISEYVIRTVDEKNYRTVLSKDVLEEFSRKTSK